MKLTSAQVQNFRSIVDSMPVRIDERATVLVGKNEQGKTSFLRALASFEPKVAYSPSDLPNHLRPSLESKPASEIPIVTLWFSFEPSDKKKLGETILNFDELAGLRVIRYFDGRYKILGQDNAGEDRILKLPEPKAPELAAKLKAEADQLRTKLKAHGVRYPGFGQYMTQVEQHYSNFINSKFDEPTGIDNVIKTFLTALRGVPNQDQPILNDVTAATAAIQKTQSDLVSELSRDPGGVIMSGFPRFIFHSSALDMIPNSVSVSQFVKDPLGTSRGMANLCNVAGLSIQKIAELSKTAAAQREAYEDHHRTSMSGAINEFWTQKSYNIHFRFESESLYVSVSDDTYKLRIPPSERSDGFQWYLSFYCALLNDDSSSRPNIVLLDNPGLELHPDGQRDIKRFLEQKLPQSTQVVYVTHSPAMIDPYNLEQVRAVELKPNQEGTKISTLMTKGALDADLLEPVRSAIGASLINSLMFNDYNVLTEGAADKPILEGAFQLLAPEMKVNINGGIAESADGFLARFYERANLPYIVYLDSDSSGRTIERNLKSKGVAAEKIIMLNSAVEGLNGEAEIEDLITPAIYDAAVKETYPERQFTLELEAGKKIAKQYEDYFQKSLGFGFSKRRVAETVKRMLLNKRVDEKTTENLKKLVSKLRAGLKGEVASVPA